MTCKNPFLESDGFCTQCGKNHLHKAPAKKHLSVTVKSTPIEIKTPVLPPPSIGKLQITDHVTSKVAPAYKKYLALYLEVHLKLLEGAIPGIELVATKKNNCFVRAKGTKNTGFRFISAISPKLLHYVSTFGFFEYRRIEKKLPHIVKVTGYKAVVLTALHETTHLLLHSENGSFKAPGSSGYHGAHFVKKYHALISKYLNAEWENAF